MTYRNKNKYLILFACCIPVKGASRSLICDVQRGKYYYIPNSLFEMIKLLKTNLLSKIYLNYDKNDYKTVDEYFTFLLENELAFITDDPDNFPEMELNWKSPSIITNSIIDIDKSSPSIKKSVEQLSDLGCSALQLRYFDMPTVQKLSEDLKCFNSSLIKTISLMMPYNEELIDYFKDIGIEKFVRIWELQFYNSPDRGTKHIKGVRIVHLSKSNFCETDCGKICRSNFSIRLEHFTEAIEHNTCLNRKLSIDKEGYIKNCPTQKFDFGHVDSVDLTEVANSQNFQKAYKISKDQIEVCKDCEYRLICTDCRILDAFGNVNLNKPSKCKYDPYKAKWN